MPIDYDRAYLRVNLRSEQHSVAEVSALLQVIDNLVSAPVWAGILDPEFSVRDEAFARVKEIVASSASRQKATGRFYPRFFLDFGYGDPDQVLRDGEFGLLEQIAGSSDPLDLGVQFGLNYWLKSEIRKVDDGLYESLFGQSRVSRLEHSSPLLLEVCLMLGASAGSVVLLTYGLLRATAAFSRRQAENRIRHAEADSKEQEALQRELQTEIVAQVRDAIREQREEGRFVVPDAAIAAAVNIASPSIAELSGSPIIKDITFGASFKAGG